jgi:hypothetical protein
MFDRGLTRWWTGHPLAESTVKAPSCCPSYVSRQPENTAIYRVAQKNLLTFEQQWTDEASGWTLPKFVPAWKTSKISQRKSASGLCVFSNGVA